jgi:hypothetical protein
MTIKDIKYGGHSLKIKRFDIKSMPDNVTIAMIAKRASGKSYLTREILFHKRDIPSTIAISKTEKLNKFYADFIPDIYIYDEYDNSILNRVYKRQSMISDDNNRKIKEGKSIKDPRAMLIMDDCMSSKGGWVKEQPISELFFNGRHYNLSFILTMQFPLGIPPEMRSNFDYIFLLADDFISNRKRLYDHYAGMFPDFNTFQQVFLDLTENFGCMVINNRVHSKDITEKVFWYKAKDTPDFTMGSKVYKKFHGKNYDKNWNKKIEVFDPSIMMSKKKQDSKFLIEKVKDS